MQLTPAIIAWLAELETALAYYATAINVKSWKSEQLRSDWAITRTALGLPEFSIEEQDALLGKAVGMCGPWSFLLMNQKSDTIQPVQ